MIQNGMVFEEFAVGQRFETGSRVIGEADVLAFAEVSGDRNPLHLDEAYGKASVFGERVAHGVLGLAVATGLVNGLGLTRGTLVALRGLRWGFEQPIRFGTVVRGVLRVEAVQETKNPARGRVTLAVELEDETGSILQRGALELLVRRR